MLTARWFVGIWGGVWVLCGLGPAQTPRGFKPFENALAGCRFCYPIVYKQLPLQPNEKIRVAKYVRKSPPPELKNLKRERYRGHEPHLYVIYFDKRAPLGENLERSKLAGSGEFSLVDWLRRLHDRWKLDPVEGKPGHYELRYPLSLFGMRETAVGYLAFREVGDHVCGAYGMTLSPHQDTLREEVEAMAMTVAPAAPSSKATKAKAELDDIYAGSTLRDIEKRKQVRSALAAGWKAIDTDNYVIVYNSSSSLLMNKMAREIEAMRRAYETVLVPAQEITAVSTVRVCRTNDEYLRYGGPRGTAGYFSSRTGELVLYDYEGTLRDQRAQGIRFAGREVSDKDSMLVLYHEALHQYTYYASGELFPHDWFGEGLGEYFSGAVNPGLGGKEMPKIEPSRWRLDLAHKQCTDGIDFVPLARLLRAERAEFYHPARAALYYAAAWSFVYFVMKSDEAQRDPRWARLVIDYYDNLKAAYAAERAKPAKPAPGEPADDPETARFKAAFAARKVAIDKTLAGIDLDALEKAWKSYVAGLKR